MGNMVQHLGNPTSTTFLHHLRDLWKSPRGTVLRIEALTIAAIVITFFLVAFGSCRRWSSRWIVQKGFFAAQALSLSLGTYSIGLMQSSSVRSDMYPIWTVSLFTLLGCIDPVTTYNGFDYKGPLSKVLYAIFLYCVYALLMSISGVSSVVGNTAICMLSAITFIKGFHRTLALVQQSRMRNTVAGFDDYYNRQANVLRYPSTGEKRIQDHEPGSRLMVELDNDRKTDLVRLGDVVRVSQKENNDSLWSCYDACVAHGLSNSLQRHFLGLSGRKVHPEPLDGVDYIWALKVVAIELAFLHDIFSTGNAYIHYYQARTACLWALVSLAGICFVGVTVAIPGAVASSRGGSTNVVGTTTANLVITFAILAFLALLQLMQLFQCWTSHWARLAVACTYVRNKRRQGSGSSNGRWGLWARKLKSFVVIDKVTKWKADWGVGWMRMRSDYRVDNRGCGKMLGLDYILEVLWDLLGSEADKRVAVQLEEVKASVTDFLGQIKDDILNGSWSSDPGYSDEEALFLPYACDPQLQSEPQGSRYTRCVLAWCVVTWHCELAEREQEQEHGGGGGMRSEDDRRNQRVANALANYCAYLVVSVPELLPGLLMDTRRARDFFADSAGSLPGDKDGLLKRVSSRLYWADLYSTQGSSHEDPRDAGSREEQFSKVYSMFNATSEDARPLVDVRNSDRWKKLVDVWVRMLVYAAPYGNSEAHMRQLSQGGEFITHLWALLYHLGIREWKPPAPGSDKPTTGGGVLTDTDNAQRIINDFSKDNEAVVVAFLRYESVGTLPSSFLHTSSRWYLYQPPPPPPRANFDRDYYSDELDAASKLEKRVSFYRTTSSEIAKLFQIRPAAKRPSLVLLNKDEEINKFTLYGFICPRGPKR
ncbi:hypothetical protein HU200_067552 [Digitaria exilis]|uniref:DUF4220 domain-containing protein n=1 Tax=Digitaria exilis TaxID=1010633 RepID=A0A835DW21_9POAL|nr:hypothetical protein HU200_067552 [Digitaria exilis]